MQLEISTTAVTFIVICGIPIGALHMFQYLPQQSSHAINLQKILYIRVTSNLNVCTKLLGTYILCTYNLPLLHIIYRYDGEANRVLSVKANIYSHVIQMKRLRV